MSRIIPFGVEPIDEVEFFTLCPVIPIMLHLFPNGLMGDPQSKVQYLVDGT